MMTLIKPKKVLMRTLINVNSRKAKRQNYFVSFSVSNVVNICAFIWNFQQPLIVGFTLLIHSFGDVADLPTQKECK
jgi:hypothetical protein